MDNQSSAPKETILVKRRKAGSAEKIDVKCPKMVEKYNKFMGGVDLMDQMKTSYQYDRKSTKKFYLRLFFDLLDIAVNNACCVYNDLETLRDPAHKRMKNLDFRQVIARGLIGGYSNRKRSVPQAPKRKSSVSSAIKPDHVMVKSSQRNRCTQCKKNKKENRTYNICETCNIHLCYTSDRNCFFDFHNE